jgi:hypothetical protein
MEKIYTFTFNGIQIQFVANSIVNAMAFANEYFIPHTGPCGAWTSDIQETSFTWTIGNFYD